ncbi:MAG: antitoxin [Tetrasphaera sp.]|nr:antitoxin [Tetrasphaera sp.]
MGVFDSMKEKVEELLGQNPDKVEELSDAGIEKAGDAVDQATGGKFSDQVDQGENMLDEKIGE